MSKRTNRKVKTILSYILSFFISLSLTICLLTFLLKGGLLNDTLLRRTINESTYNDEKLELLIESLGFRLEEVGLPSEMAKDVVRSQMVNIATNKLIQNALEGSEMSVDTQELEEGLRSNIATYMKDKGIESTEEITVMIDRISSEASQSYATQMLLPALGLYYDFVKKYDSIVSTVLYINLCIFLLCSIVVVFIHRKKYRGLRYVSYGVLASAIMTFVMSVLMEGQMLRVMPSDNQTYYRMFRSYITESFRQGIYMGLSGILIFCLLILLTKYLRKEAI